jgi:acyl-CoA thioesterase-1
MNSEIQSKIQQIVLVMGITLFVFWSYSATDYLRQDPPVLNPVAYDRFDVVVLGDSITEGLGVSPEENYVSLLREEFQWAKIYNAGVRGDTTEDALARFEEDVLAHDPDVLLILLGGNDVLHRKETEGTFSNLKEMISLAHYDAIEVVIAAVPGAAFSDPYKDHFEELDSMVSVTVIPNVLDGVLGKSKLMKDPIHPNREGHRVIFERIAPIFGDILQKYY